MPERLTPSERRLRGTRGHPERIAGYIAPVGRPPRAPAGLGDAGRRLWRSAWHEAAWLTPLDRTLVELAARSADEVARLESEIATTGVVANGSKGQPTHHPLVRLRDAALDRLRRYLAELGMSPVARRRLGIETRPAPEPVDAVERFLGARREAPR